MKLFSAAWLFLFLVSISQAAPPDLIIFNANIRTMDGVHPTAQAVAIADGRFTAVGSNVEILNLAGVHTEKINAENKLLIPGFNDSHVHFASIGTKFSSIDLSSSYTAEIVLQRIVEFVSVLPKERWILGRGLRRELVTESLLKLIDRAAPDNPVFIYQTNPQRAFANTRAYRVAKLTNFESRGELFGESLRRLVKVVPPNHVRDWPQVLATASNYAAALGVTSVQDMHSDDLTEVYRNLEASGKLKTRIYDCSAIDKAKPSAKHHNVRPRIRSLVRSGCVKAFVDTETNTQTLFDDIAIADAAGFQIMTHAIGDEANRILLDVYEKVAAKNGKRDRRFRIEHAENVSSRDISKFGENKIIASRQPWLFRSSKQSDLAKFYKNGVKLSFGSDAAITEFSPLFGVSAAVESGLSVENAVYAYTAGAAFAEFQELDKGSISKGKFADLVVLSDNIFKNEPAAIRMSRVLLTIVDGRIVYRGGL